MSTGPSATRRGFLGTVTAATGASQWRAGRSEAQPDQIAQAAHHRQRPRRQPLRTSDWTKPAAMAIPKEGYFNLNRAGTARSFRERRRVMASRSSPRSSRAPRTTIRAYGKTIEKAIEGRPACARPAQAALPPVGAVRHRRRHVLHVPGHLRYRFRQVHRGCRRAVQGTGVDTIFENSKDSRRTGRPTRRPSSSSSANTSARASSNTANIRTSRGRNQEGARSSSRRSRRCSTDAVSIDGRHILDLEDIQHFLLTRTPALAARYEFLSFESAAAGRAWLAGLVDKVGTGQSVGTRITRRSAGSRLPSPATGCARSASTTARSRRSRRNSARDGRSGGDSRHRRRQQSRSLGRRSRELRPSCDRDSVRTRRRGARSLRSATSRLLSTLTGVKVLSALNLEALPPFDGVAREHFGYRDRLSQPVIAGTGEEPTPGFRTAGEGRRVLPRVRRRERSAAAAAPAGGALAQWQLSRLPAHGRARRRVPGIPAAAIGDAGPAGTAGGEADGTVAQRRAAGALLRTRTTRRSAAIRSGPTIFFTRRPTRTAIAARSAPISAA